VARLSLIEPWKVVIGIHRFEGGAVSSLQTGLLDFDRMYRCSAYAALRSSRSPALLQK
jgi:hypothetical protein